MAAANAAARFSLRQATITAVAVVQSAGYEPWTIDVLPTAKFDIRLGLEHMPELMSVTQAAEALMISRTAV